MTSQENTHAPLKAIPSALATWLLFAAIFASVQFASLFTPPLMDDVDASHAQTAQYIIDTGDWVTTKTNGIRYIEKPPLPFWLVSIVYRVAGENAFATHLPNALAILGLAWLSWLWARRAWSPRAGLYAGLGVLTSVGPFLFTRFIIPESILSFLLLVALYSLLTTFEFNQPLRIYWMWAALALAMLTKGLIAPVFFFGGAIPYLLMSGRWRAWRSLKPFSGILLFLAIAAPWHILVGLANPDQGHPVGNHPTVGNVHGFWWFYFINEHVLRFFNQRYPHDYNKLPFAAYWLLHIVWLFPWSLFLPALFAVAWKARRRWLSSLRETATLPKKPRGREPVAQQEFRMQTIWLLSLFTGFTLIFFSISSNQEYYTFMVWPPLFILIAGAVAAIEEGSNSVGTSQSLPSMAWLASAQAVFAVVGLVIAAALGWGLWDSRNLPFVPDIGSLLAHRAVAGYTLSMSHFFDLTGPSFAALRLPAALAGIAFLVGPAAGWLLRRKGKHLAATISVALTSAVFLVAAHLAFARFAPMLGSKQMADTITNKGTPADTFIILGEQSDASSVIFYSHNFFHGKPALLVLPRCGQHGEGSTLLWGSCYPDAPDIFISDAQLAKQWGTGERKWLFAQDTNRAKAEQILSGRLYLVQVLADKSLWTDRPLQ
jgi:4-amino-4-deoxy-L-arabinose transferase-like glycosyltransferase